MATWDGSYCEPEDQNYYVYPDQNISGPSRSNWTFGPSETNNDYLQANKQYYVQNGPTFEQNYPTTYHHLDANVSSVPSNLMTVVNSYHSDATQVPSTLEYFSNNVKSERCFDSPQGWSNNHDPRITKNKYTLVKDTSIQSGIAKQSNLHATANEFVPNNLNLENLDKENVNIKGSRLKSQALDTNSMYDRNKHVRRYEGTRSMNYDRKEGHYRQVQRGSRYKNAYRPQSRNYSKFPNNKYPCHKDNFDKSQDDRCVDKRTSITDEVNDIDISNSEECTTFLANYKKEEPSGMNTDVYGNKKLTNETNDRRNVAIQDAVHQPNRGKWYSHQNKEHIDSNSNSRWSQGQHRNIKKYSFNIRQDRDGNNLKDTRHNFEKYSGTRDTTYSRDDKTETKDKTYGYQDYNGFKEYHTKENNSPIFDNKEKRNEYRRSKKENNEKSNGHNRGQNDDASQRERLMDQLNKGQLECLVCCEYIKQTDYVWSCSNCHHVLHLKCIKKWAKSSQGGTKRFA